MKKYILALVVGLMTVAPASAQHYRGSRYYNRQTGRLDYSRRQPGRQHYTQGPRYSSFYNYRGNYDAKPYYVGLRVGPSFGTVHSDNHYLDGSSMKTGLNLGLAAGVGLTPSTPLFFETGLYYIEKGGKNSKGNSDFNYKLNYLEVPLVLKYIYNFDNNISIQPFFGGYLAGGVGGKIRDFQNREAYNSFGEGIDQFKRFDGGLRMGVGLGLDVFYVDLTYDLGLSNIGHDYFDDTRTSTLQLNVGVNF